MKKLLLILLTITVTFGLVACVEDEPDPQPYCPLDKEIIDGVCVGVDDPNEGVECGYGEFAEDGECVDVEDLSITIVDQNIYVDGEPFWIKGICWNPVPKGGNHPNSLDFAGTVAVDAQLMADAGINVVRTYEPITDTEVLDVLWSHGIYVINTVYSYGGSSAQSAVNHVKAVKDHPAILMWAIGNEWNYNGIYANLSLVNAKEKLNDVARAIREEDPTHPITTIYGYLPSSFTIQTMPDIDVWGLNVYSGITFGNLFQQYANISDKPMYLAEYGADAWNANIDSLDEESQAEATRTLTQIIINLSSGAYPNNYTIGGTIFSFNDEWWKDSEGSLDTHDTGGYAPGGGPYPDNTFNEEFWGIVDIDRNPREAYYALQELYVGTTED